MDSDTCKYITAQMLHESQSKNLVLQDVIEAKQKEIENKDRIIRVLNNKLKGKEYARFI